MKGNITQIPEAQEFYPDKVIILGTEIEADFCEADLYERLENIRKGLTKYSPTKTNDMAAAIHEQCELVFECFDELFGDGTAVKIFGGRTNIRLCLQAFSDLMVQANGQIAAVKDNVKTVAGNRAQRRLSLNE